MTADGNGRAATGRLAYALMRLFAPAVLAVAGTWAVVDAVVSGSPTPRDPGFADSLLASSAVLAATRLAIIAAATYVVASVAALAARRQWLTRVGPVEVSEQASDLDTENTALKEMLARAEARVEALEESLANAEDALDTMVRWRRR